MDSAPNYLVCATPRTGSTLLCGLLSSTAVAGRPESYFREEDLSLWADRWSLTPDNSGRVPRADFYNAARVAGTTENGVFAARVMWGTIEQVVDDLRQIGRRDSRRDVDILERAFGPLTFVHLKRRSVVDQAVSWLRAEQTHVWHDMGEGVTPQNEPRYDFGGIDTRVRTIVQHNDAWREWFTANNIEPWSIEYEGLIADPPGVIRDLTERLGIAVPVTASITAPTRRLADQVNVDWARQYRRDIAAAAQCWPPGSARR